jgi:hypothetical protein
MSDLDEAAAKLKGLLGVTDDSPSAVAWRNYSQRDCSCCGKCGKPLAPDERVCRTRLVERVSSAACLTASSRFAKRVLCKIGIGNTAT